MPFAPAFTGAALTRPDAPATAIGFVNGSASLAIVVGSPCSVSRSPVTANRLCHRGGDLGGSPVRAAE